MCTAVAKVCGNKHIVGTKQHDPKHLAPNFAFVSEDCFLKTIDHTTQYARMDTRLPLQKHFKSRFPAANVSRLKKTVATDTFFFDSPALDDGIMGHGGTAMLQLYCGCESQLTAVFPMKTENEMAGTLEDFICFHGAPNALFSANAKAPIGCAVQEILHMYTIKNFQCEPHHQHQNLAERQIQEVKKLSNQMLDCTGAPPNLWLLCVLFIVYLINHVSSESLGWHTPIEAATGQQPDISALLVFCRYEPIYYKTYSSATFPSSSIERHGHVVPIAKHKGDALTFLVLDSLTNQVVTRSETGSAPNFRAVVTGHFSLDGGECPSHKPITSSTDVARLGIDPSELKLARFSPDKLVGKVFVRSPDYGQNYCAKVFCKIQDHDADCHKQIKFLFEIGDGQYNEIMACHKLCDYIETQEDQEINPEEP
jgi:hypothetical protein